MHKSRITGSPGLSIFVSLVNCSLMCLALLSIGPASLAAQEVYLETEDRRIYVIEGEFEFYREMLESAVGDQGMVVNYVGRIGAMLDRTGADLGASEQLYGNAESLEFCSAVYSRQMMTADPHTIVFCPYVIAIYELAGAPGTIYIGYQRMPQGTDPETQAALQAVEALLDRVVNAALEF